MKRAVEETLPAPPTPGDTASPCGVQRCFLWECFRVLPESLGSQLSSWRLPSYSQQLEEIKFRS